MNQTPKERPLAELAGANPKPSDALRETTQLTARLNRKQPAAQRRMQAKQSAESGANHARHHTSRKTQS